MKSTPLILNSPADAGKHLFRVESRVNDSRDEHWLQELLISHPELLPVESFDGPFSPAIPLGREVLTGSGPVDNLYVSPDGFLTIVETKLWKNPEKHRTVVAQVIDYATRIAAWDYDQLCQAVLASSRKRGETERVSLEEKVQAALVDGDYRIPIHEFQEGVASSLATGSFLLLIIGDRISPNIALLTKAIQSAPGLNFRLGLVEMQLFQQSEGESWPLIIVPEVVGRTVEVMRGVVQVRYKQEKPQVSIDISDDPAIVEVDGTLDLETFLLGLPKDLVAPFEEGIRNWQQIGGTLHHTPRMLFFVAELCGVSQWVIRCRATALRFPTSKWIEDWGGTPTIIENYLASLESSPTILKELRGGKSWVKYAKLSPEEIRVFFAAVMQFVAEIRANSRSEVT